MMYVKNSNPMPMLTSLTLKSMDLYDQHLNMWNKCFPNLQVLNMVDVRGLKDPKIQFLNLKACHLNAYINNLSSLTLITPNLITLKIVCYTFDAIYVEAPMLSHFHLKIFALEPKRIFKVKRFENLKTLSLNSFYTGSLLSKFPIKNTVETVTLYSQPKAPGETLDLELCLGKVFKVFPNVSSLCVNAYAWSGFEACFNKEGSEILDGRNRLKTICAHVLLDDPSLTFLYVACVLDQCVGLSEFSFLIHSDVSVTEFRSFMSKCMARWPDLKWRWGRYTNDCWITDGISN
ncbi:F-box/LRR-repeat protein At4g29420-like [Bidens hawaiensis]|uniref:F-box/LRR-repeat protein At4g29420-like n=1 Tax=Bidens hawaiensis TaxID=980011 RepID=UPI0040491E47